MVHICEWKSSGGRELNSKCWNVLTGLPFNSTWPHKEISAKQHTVAHSADWAGVVLTVQDRRAGLVAALGSALLCMAWSLSICKLRVTWKSIYLRFKVSHWESSLEPDVRNTSNCVRSHKSRTDSCSNDVFVITVQPTTTDLPNIKASKMIDSSLCPPSERYLSVSRRILLSFSPTLYSYCHQADGCQA